MDGRITRSSPTSLSPRLNNVERTNFSMHADMIVSFVQEGKQGKDTWSIRGIVSYTFSGSFVLHKSRVAIGMSSSTHYLRATQERVTHHRRPCSKLTENHAEQEKYSLAKAQELTHGAAADGDGVPRRNHPWIGNLHISSPCSRSGVGEEPVASCFEGETIQGRLGSCGGGSESKEERRETYVGFGLVVLCGGLLIRAFQ